MLLVKQLLMLLPLLEAVAAKPIDHGFELTNWLKDNKGYFNPKLELRRQVFGDADPDAETPFYGMFAIEDIPKGEVMLEIPEKLLVSPTEVPLQIGDRISVWFEEHEEWFGGEIIGLVGSGGNGAMDVQFDDGDQETVFENSRWEREEDLDCTTVRRLAKEVSLGKESDFKPYIQYLQSQPRGQLPATWSEAGKDLLRELLGPLRKDESVNDFVSEEPHTILPPELGTRNSYAQDFHDRCASRLPTELSDEEFEDYLNWYSLLNQRGWDELMIPVFDMMSHGNGKLLNTDHGSVRDGETIQVFARRDIAKGEEIYTTYNFCANCENRFMGYGTPELLRDYGFVEGFPQRWFFHEQRLAFELDVEEDGKYVVSWLRKMPPKESFVFMKEQLVRLRELSNTVLSDLAAINAVYEAPVPQHEWDTILGYQKALVVAMTEALKSAGMDPAQLCEDSASDSDETCHTRLAYYDDLEFVDPKDEDWVIDRPATCNEGPEGEWHPFHTNPSRGLQTIHSPYQHIEFYANVLRNDDTCFQLDSVVQICQSYRPHYHEQVVHNTARYLEDDLERVVFVGGGDSMLLYDIIKYPTLKKVVGLEIDQHVTRGSFEHFGTEPHWDKHDKVEWWFGDASKSLLMLPKEYFGSFDMVLVDLSETAASLTVTDHLNVMEALSLLLKPNGILVKNEYNYFPEQKHVFRDTLHIHYYNVPYVCSQSLILGSNGIDFMRGKYTIHDVEHMYELLDDPEMHYGYVHDYQKNYSNPVRYCEKKSKTADSTPKQEKSPGIIMIIEAEDVTMDLSSMDKVREAVEKTVKEHQLTVVKSFEPETAKGRVLVTVLKEGYIVCRLFPEHNYVGFDFQMWSSYGKQELVKNSLIEAVGSKVGGGSSSAYRVVTGGMFGLETWESDEENRGPKLKSCDELEAEDAVRTYEEPMDMEAAVLAVKESQLLVNDFEKYTAAVLCGRGSSCKTNEVMKNLDRVSNVITLESCPGVEDFEYMPDALRRMGECEIEMWKTVKEQVSQYGRIRSIVLDPSATHSMAQIFYRLSESAVNQNMFFEENMTVAAPLIDLSEDWRRAFVDKFRTDVFPEDPTFRADVFFNSSSTSFMMSLASSGDFNFAEGLVEFVNVTEEKTGLVGEINSIRGCTYEGFIVQDPILTNDNFTNADFGLAHELDHWNSQHPMGLQIIFQFEMKDKRAESMNAEKATELLERSLKPVVEEDQDVQYEVFADLGDGTLVSAVWVDGSAMLLHDGRNHIDANLFLYEEAFEKVIDFETTFTSCTTFARCVPDITRTLRDTQPRGTGRVVSFMRDLRGLDAAGKPVKTPRWAAHLV